MPSNTSPLSLITPIINPEPKALPTALSSWNDVMTACKHACSALNDVDDHYTAFLALRVLQSAIHTYESHLTTRPPKTGDLTNLQSLSERLRASDANHETFIDEPHLDYLALRKKVLADLQNLLENTARRGALHAIGIASEAFAPLSYSSSIDAMQLIEDAVKFIESYYSLSPILPQILDIKPLAGTLQIIAASESAGFPDYKDEQFAIMFEDLTVRMGRLHLDRTKNKLPA